MVLISRSSVRQEDAITDSGNDYK